MASLPLEKCAAKTCIKNIKSDVVDIDSLKTHVIGITNVLGLEFTAVNAQQIGNPNSGTAKSAIRHVRNPLWSLSQKKSNAWMFF